MKHPTTSASGPASFPGSAVSMAPPENPAALCTAAPTDSGNGEEARAAGSGGPAALPRKKTPEEKRTAANIASKKWKLANPKKVQEIASNWKLANPDKAREIRRKAARKYYEANPEKASAWSRANPEKARIVKRQWENRNRDHTRANSLRWAKENPERMREIQRRWRANNWAKVAVKNGHHRSAVGNFTAQDLIDLLHVQENKCAACHIQLTATGNSKRTVDHILPIILGGSHYPSNIQLLCSQCNHRKGVKSPEEWHALLASLPPDWRQRKNPEVQHQ